MLIQGHFNIFVNINQQKLRERHSFSVKIYPYALLVEPRCLSCRQMRIQFDVDNNLFLNKKNVGASLNK